ncbi:hypothetical protein V8E51_017673 [Hyaloscypha variabilis]
MADIGLSGSSLGIASLAFQVGDSIMRLKSFWDSVKDAPEDIKHLIEEIETLSSVLSDFETTATDQPEPEIGNEARSKCIQFCRNAVGILDDVVKNIEVEVKKRRRVGSVKAVLKKAEIAKLRERLMTAQSILILSNNSYLVAVQRRNQQMHHDWAKSHQQQLHQLGVIVTQSTETIKSCSSSYKRDQGLILANESTSDASQSEALPSNALQQTPRTLHGNSNKISNFKVRLHTPKWLFGFSRAIEVYEARANGAWNFNVQIYNVVPDSAPVFKMIENDDIEGVQTLFRTRQASPFDRTVSGWTLLDEAAYHQHLRICQLLKNQGSDPNISHHSSALGVACLSVNAFDHSKRFHDIVDFFLPDIVLQDPFEDEASKYLWRIWPGNAHTFSNMLQIASPAYRLRSLEERVLFALSCRTDNPHMARLVRVILTGPELNEQVCSIKDHENGPWPNRTLLHLAVNNLGELLMSGHAEQGATIKELLYLITELITGGSGLHDNDSSGMTPMRAMFRAFCYQYHRRPADHQGLDTLSNITGKWNKPLGVWLKLLKATGVDLVRYGREEKEILQQKYNLREQSFERRVRESDSYGLRFFRLRLINFIYGPEPEDWKFWFAPAMTTYFMDFWDMVDHPERAMPGAWEDGYSFHDWSYYNRYDD